jgi:hypothetical protein
MPPLKKKKVIQEKKIPYEPDIEFIHNIIRAELAVVEAEKEKEAKEKDKESRLEYDNKSLNKFRSFCYWLSSKEIIMYSN